jgi:hypothetical protein
MRKIVLVFFVALSGALGARLGADLYPMLVTKNWSALGNGLLHDHAFQAAVLSVVLSTVGYVIGLRKFGFNMDQIDGTFVLGAGGLIIGKFITLTWSFLDGKSEQFSADFAENPYLNSYIFILAIVWIASSMFRVFNRPIKPI